MPLSARACLCEHDVDAEAAYLDGIRGGPGAAPSGHAAPGGHAAGAESKKPSVMDKLSSMGSSPCTLFLVVVVVVATTAAAFRAGMLLR